MNNLNNLTKEELQELEDEEVEFDLHQNDEVEFKKCGK